MTHKEAVELLRKSSNDSSRFSKDERSAFLQAISAIKKQIPKKPIEDGYYDEPAVCPNCGENVINMADNDYHFQHCHYCGQALDWSETE